MTRAYVEDTDRLGLGRPDDEPLASETIAEIVELIEALIERGHAYESGGDVYFRVRSFPGYGKLSNRDPEEMDQGEEAGTESLKEDPLDFALWKARKPDEDTAWDSPWGEGRPGWHIECSAMAEKLLGTDFAIHGGGVDLVFPHHENEIAQTEAARGVPLARLWMHNGMVQMDEEKMSKSVGNIFQLSEALDRYGPRGRGRLPDLGPLPPAARVLGAGAGARRPRGSSGSATSCASLPDGVDGGRGRVRDRAPRGASRRARRRLQHAAGDGRAVRAGRRGEPAGSSPGARAALEEMLALLGLESLLAAGGRRSIRRPSGCWRSARQAARRATSSGPTRSATSSPRAGWEVRDSPEGARLVRRSG